LYVDNLVDSLITCALHPNAANNTYLLADGDDISTPDLVRLLANGMAVPAYLFACPPVLLRLAGKLTGKSQQLERLLGSLRINNDKIRTELNWVPPYTVRQGLRATAQWYRTHHT
jgi:nucleoside-diphosphate-sugar epimerase